MHRDGIRERLKRRDLRRSWPVETPDQRSHELHRLTVIGDGKMRAW
jgi:hypothetical protein